MKSFLLFLSFQPFCRLPMNFYWDSDDARFLACQTRRIPQATDKRAPPTSMSTMRRTSETNAKSPNHPLASVQEYASDSQVEVLFIKSGSKMELKQMEQINLVVSEELVNLCAPYLVRVFVWLAWHGVDET